MYGGMSVSAPSLHRESTDSLISDNQKEQGRENRYKIEEQHIKIMTYMVTGRKSKLQTAESILGRWQQKEYSVEVRVFRRKQPFLYPQ